MARNWEVVGEGANRQHKLTITTSGRQPQVFYGKTKTEIAEQLADAQEHATETIETLKREGKTPTPRTPQPAAPRTIKPLEAGERMQLVSDMGNPAKIDQAVTRIVEATVGSLSDLQRSVTRANQDDAVNAAVAAARKFAEDTPDWFPSEHNKKTLARYMEAQAMNPAQVEAYASAFESLKAAGLLQEAPNVEQEPATEPEPIAQPKPVTQPTRMSTGVRPSDMGGSNTPPARRLKYTREELSKMSGSRYKELMMSDPELGRCVEAYAAEDRRRTA